MEHHAGQRCRSKRAVSSWKEMNEIGESETGGRTVYFAGYAADRLSTGLRDGGRTRLSLSLERYKRAPVGAA